MSNMEKLEGLNRKISVNVPAQEVTEAFNDAYNVIKRQAKVPGFRQGKVPIQKIKSMYVDRVKQDVVEKLINKNYGQALKTHELNPIEFPKIDFQKIEEGEDFNFTATFEIRPTVNVDKYEGLNVQKEKVNITEEKVNEVLQNMQKHHAEETPILEDRTAKSGDIAQIDFEGIVDGAPLENGTAKDFKLELGSNSFIPGFEEGIIGMKVGVEIDLNLNFPEEYHEKSIAGKPVTFKVKLNQLLKKTLPELNDDLAQKIDPSIKTFEDLKTRINDDLNKDETKRVSADLKNRILKELVNQNPVEVPNTLLKEQKQKLVEDTKNRLKQQGFTDKDWEEYHKKWDADLNQTASFMIQSSFLIDELSDKLKIKATNEDFENKFEEYAQQMNVDVELLKGYYKDEQKSQLGYQIVEDKIVQHLIEKANIKEVDAGDLKE